MKVLLILTLTFASCNSQTIKKSTLENGIWIPTKIDWNEGNFKTIYVYNDSSFLLINSTQKLIKDSIYFEAEPGYSLYKCSTKIISNKLVASSVKLYSFISLPIKEDSIDTLEIEIKQGNYLVVNGQEFQQTNKYISHSVQTIKGLVNNYPKY